MTALALLLLPSGVQAANTAAPVIDNLTATPPSVRPGEAITLTVEAHDPDCTAGVCTTGCGAYIRDDLTVWSTVGGTFGTLVKIAPGTPGSTATGNRSPYVGQATWTAPTTEGTYVIAVSIPDSGTFLCGGRRSTSATIPVQVSLVPNQPPTVISLTATPGQVFPGDYVTLSCSASDPDGDPVAYGWSTDRGSVTGSGQTATFTSDQPAIAAVTCTATDSRGGIGTKSIQVSVTDAKAEASLTPNLFAPLRISADSFGSLYVVDPPSGGVAVLNFFSRELVYRIPMPGVTSVAVDWENRLLVGGASGARLVNRAGGLLRQLDPGESAGAAADVAVDSANRRYGVLYGDAARVVLFDSTGAKLGAFGAIGPGAADLKRPAGLAFLPGGRVAVADNGLSLVKVFETTGALVTSFGGGGGGAGKFVQLAGIATDARGVIYASDAFQGWVQCFNPDGTLREVLGGFGDGVGRFKTPVGIAAPPALSRVLVASANSSSIQVFRTGGPDPVTRLPAPGVAPGSLSFGTQAVDTKSEPQRVTLRNSGDAPLGIRSATLSGDYLETHDCASFLDPGQECAFRVSFIPLTSGRLGGELVIDTSAANGRLTVSLVGEAIFPPAIALSPSLVAFRSQVVSSTSAARSVLMTNAGGSPLAIAGMRLSGPFGFSSGCGALVPAGTSCGVDLTFTPQAVGPATGALAVDSNAATGNSVVALEGTGIAPSLSLEPASLDFGRQKLGERSKARKLTLTNLLGTRLAVGATAIEGSAATAFVITADRCQGRSLAPTGVCHVRVAFEPDVEGQLRARLRIESDAPEGAVSADLAGTGDAVGGDLIFRSDFESGDLSQWTLVVTPSEISVRLPQGDTVAPVTLRVSVGAQAVGAEKTPRMLTVANGGDVPVDVEAVTLSGAQAAEFRVREDLCSGRQLAPGAACKVSVAFVPTEAGPASAELRVSFGGATSPAVFVLTGVGTPRERQP